MKTLDAKVELITNGTLLTQGMSKELIAAGLDMLWISLDGATPEITPMCGSVLLCQRYWLTLGVLVMPVVFPFITGSLTSPLPGRWGIEYL